MTRATHAAEPATAPAPTAAPAGRIVHVGALPQGIVYDATSHLVAVAVQKPDRLLLLDPSTLAVRRSVPLPGSVRHLQLARVGDTVLVPVETSNQLVQVAVPSGRTTATDVLKQPHDAAGLSNGDIAVGDEFGRALSIIRDGKVIKTFRDLEQPGGVVADGSTVVVVDVRAFSVSTYDLTTMRRTAQLPAGAGPTHGVLVGHHRIAVADTRGNQVLIFDDAPLRRVGRLALPGTPYGMAVDPSTGLVWVTLTARNQLVGIRVGAGRPKIVARYDTVRQPDTVAVQPGSHTLFVTGTDSGVVERIER
ncbi:YncE family protein [Jatrophihabitans endophyticus]|uniref:YncE family protein n=1 Tax=Jatrophihabitans endophyticus TaxID=1206085 RepID=UPI0019FCF3B7|nr:hypothetical protein [Jatrophihabitans endophyticus]MBE7188350.1 YncE family protein [Jatrophihabitans endophyticus]